MLKIFQDSFAKRMNEVELLSKPHTLASPLCRVLFDQSNSWKLCLLNVSFCFENSILKYMNMSVFSYIGLRVELGDGHSVGTKSDSLSKKVKIFDFG